MDNVIADVVMGKLTLRAGTVVQVAGWPVRLTADVDVEMNISNVPLVERDLARPDLGVTEQSPA